MCMPPASFLQVQEAQWPRRGSVQFSLFHSRIITDTLRSKKKLSSVLSTVTEDVAGASYDTGRMRSKLNR